MWQRMNWPPGNRQREAEASSSAAAAEEQHQRGREMGERLREAREALDLSVADAERDTKINHLYLEALEAARFDTLPAPVYARGFMRSYARYLGLDPEEASAAVPRDLPRPAGLEPLPGLRRTASSMPAWPGLPALNTPVLAAIAGTAAVILIVVFVLPRLGGGPGVDLPATPATPGVEATPTTPAATPASVATVPPFEPGTVPEFTGVTIEEAERVMAEAGINPLIFETRNPAPAGQVFEQSPAPGTEIEPGGTVTLFVSQGP
jgi:cytoskeleton protein RodZ